MAHAEAVHLVDVLLRQESHKRDQQDNDAALGDELVLEAPGREDKGKEYNQSKDDRAFEQSDSQYVSEDDRDLPDIQIHQPARSVPTCPQQGPGEYDEHDD